MLIAVVLVAIVFIVVATARFKVHPFLALIAAAYLTGFLVGMPLSELVDTINTGFGNMMRHIGLVIVAGTLIGVILEKSGGAICMAEKILALLGGRRPQLAMSLIGGLVSIPVFCDSGYVILSSLNQAIARRGRVPLASMSVALATGLYATHTLVPPTPGPIAAAGNLGVSDYLGLVILVGLVVSLPAILVGYLWAIFVAARFPIEGEEVEEDETELSLETRSLPAAWKSFAPLVIPVFLIGLSSIVKISGFEGRFASLCIFLGTPITALFIAFLFSLLLLPRRDAALLNEWVKEGIYHGAPILLITGAGGAFGAVLSATPISELVQGIAEGGLFDGALVLVLPFLIAAGLKSAQGSSTASLVMTSALVAPFLPTLGITSPLQLTLMVMAVGAGSMTVSHANDSYFWVVTQFSGMSVNTAYKTLTLSTLIQGITTFIMTFLLYAVFV
ncbi:MAG: GntP family permease [Candidatus Hydrogenedens sp.]|nr:GntP family permease [Candidatus Hydrogenedens sp.]